MELQVLLFQKIKESLPAHISLVDEISELLNIADQRLGDNKMVEAAIVDIDAPSDGDAVAEMVAARFDPSRIHRSTVSPVVGTHVGPGAIGVAFYGE